MSTMKAIVCALPLLAQSQPWNSQADIPCGAVPSPKLAKFDRCIIGNQCETGFCCPFLKVCLTSSAEAFPCSGDRANKPPCSWLYVSETACGRTLQGTAPNQWCDICDRGTMSMGNGPYVCKEVTLNGATSILLTKDAGLSAALSPPADAGPWDTLQTQCNCQSNFNKAYLQKTWVARWVTNDYVPVCTTCADSPSGWTSSSGGSCESYGTDQLCTPSGGYGSGWEASWSATFASYANNGKNALQVCCGCGGGTTASGSGGSGGSSGSGSSGGSSGSGGSGGSSGSGGSGGSSGSGGSGSGGATTANKTALGTTSGAHANGLSGVVGCLALAAALRVAA